jgi:hypothetical protein
MRIGMGICNPSRRPVVMDEAPTRMCANAFSMWLYTKRAKMDAQCHEIVGRPARMAPPAE